MAGPEIAIPDPSLVVLIGAAGAGKSTFAKRHFEAAEILSSDDFRARIAGDAADQSATGPAFAALHRALGHRLRNGRLTVVDATNLRRSSRRALLARAAAAGVPAVAIVIDPPADLVRSRAAERTERHVPAAVVERHLGELAALLGREDGRPSSLAGEGFAAVHRLERADLDAVVRRRSSPRAGRPA